MMTKITNTSDIRQPVHTTSGVVFIHPGKTRDLDLTDPGKKLVEASDALTTASKRGRKGAKEGQGQPEEGSWT